ncbi:Mis12 protein-domain-containing protein [Vararia minispora EC-137]|uniref:Mis12 protein-domain-containing protein n=1 Tax=Vararia minispora EC-137 TaxID=1314806 RepID=A0ACB8QPE7_9AGAM|nr:Mis12 protein-domain-containing protein [Vararia minispora EC-137]
MTTTPPPAPNILVNELLGFSPQLLLDDIINIANDAIGKAVAAMENQLNRWADERSGAKESDDWDSAQEVEQGIVAFETLLQFHTDVAFDFFEDWSLRNIFSFAAELPVIAPHQAGLDLDIPPEREGELLAEIEDLRRKIDNQHRLRRLIQRADHISAAREALAQRRLARAIALRPPNTDALCKLPAELTSLYESASALPDFDLAQIRLSHPESGKQPWLTGKAGYTQWAVQRLVSQAGKGTKKGKPTEAGQSSGADGESQVVPWKATPEDVAMAMDNL